MFSSDENFVINVFWSDFCIFQGDVDMEGKEGNDCLHFSFTSDD